VKPDGEVCELHSDFLGDASTEQIMLSELLLAKVLEKAATRCTETAEIRSRVSTDTASASARSVVKHPLATIAHAPAAA